MLHHTDHANVRAIQRYGFQPAPADWREGVWRIIDAVQGFPSGARFIREGSADTELWAVPIRGVVMVLVYRPEWAIVVSALPRWVS